MLVYSERVVSGFFLSNLLSKLIPNQTFKFWLLDFWLWLSLSLLLLRDVTTYHSLSIELSLVQQGYLWCLLCLVAGE